jgi:hypothetical protein
MNAAVKGRSTQFLLPAPPNLNPTPDKPPMTAKNDVIPVFSIDPSAPLANVLPALARLLIDMDRRLKLTNDGAPMMLKELDPTTPWMQQPCPSQN